MFLLVKNTAMEPFSFTYYNNDIAINEESAFYGRIGIATPDNRYITVPQAASSRKFIFYKGFPFSLQREKAITTKNEVYGNSVNREKDL